MVRIGAAVYTWLTALTIPLPRLKPHIPSSRMRMELGAWGRGFDGLLRCLLSEGSRAGNQNPKACCTLLMALHDEVPKTPSLCFSILAASATLIRMQALTRRGG